LIEESFDDDIGVDAGELAALVQSPGNPIVVSRPLQIQGCGVDIGVSSKGS
jgi:hypothetical protein